MRRLLLAMAVLLVLSLGSVWLLRPRPGESLFKDWKPTSVHRAWTITGSPDSTSYVLLDRVGAFQPRRDGYSVRFFIYDRDSGSLHSASPSRTKRSLIHSSPTGARYVMPEFAWSAGDIRLHETISAGSLECRATMAVENTGGTARRVTLFAAATPYAPAGAIGGSSDVRYDRASGSILVDGKALFSCDTSPSDGAAVAAEDVDITGYIRRGALPRGAFARGADGMITSGAVGFDLTLRPHQKRVVTLRAPVSDASVRQPGGASDRTWTERLGRVGLSLPDRRVEDCFYASAAYLVMMSNDGRPVPGPTKYRMTWVRDCAYILDALYYSGQGDLVTRPLGHLRDAQLRNGGFPPKLMIGADDELDAPGEVIYALVQHYRRTGDAKWLARQWPCIERTCRYIGAKRVGVALRPHPSPLPRERGHGGVLPASVSAEDLGDGDQQHYWDDFWCIRGLKDAAYAAGMLGKREDAAWIAAEAESLSRATRASIEATMARHSIDYIPNGPDEVLSSSMARGTSCALWPCAALDPSDALVRRSFDVYWTKWIAPSDGGFIHREHFWPYAGMDLAQGYVILGQRERAWKMLKWTLEHDPTGGFYSWPEGMFADDLMLAEGDMPHGWMCAAYVSMVRNMLVRESGRDLVLMAGVPKEWLKPGARIAIRDFPTEFGKVSFEAKVVGDVLELKLPGVRPAGAYRVDLPGGRTKVLPRDSRRASVGLRG